MSCEERKFWVCNVCEVEEVQGGGIFGKDPPRDWRRQRRSDVVVCPKCLARFAKPIEMVTNELLKLQVSIAAAHGFEPCDGDSFFSEVIKDTVIRTIIDFRSAGYTSPDMRRTIKENAAKDAAAAAVERAVDAADAVAEPKED